jgi:Mrp family chromosome partitioning ATPase
VVERLKQAIEKARQAREGQPGIDMLPRTRESQPTDRNVDTGVNWASLPIVERALLDLERNRIVTVDRNHPAHAEFDHLRTRILKLCKDNGWTQIAITSPTRNCGKTMIATNLAFSLARSPTTRTLLVELDLRAPSLRRIVDYPIEHGIDKLLLGEQAPADVTLRLTPNLALCMANESIADSAELLLQPKSLDHLKALQRYLAPHVTLFDMPPLFGCDDTLAFLPNVDAVLIVAGAGVTTADDIRDCQYLIGNSSNVIGIVMNKVSKRASDEYAYSASDVSV